MDDTIGADTGITETDESNTSGLKSQNKLCVLETEDSTDSHVISGNVQPIFIMTSSNDDLKSLKEVGIDGSCVHVPDDDCLYVLNISENVAISQTKERGKNPQRHYKNRDSSDISQSWFTTKSDKDFMSQKGAQWRRGLWQRDEIELLEKNIVEYCEQVGVSEPREIIFNMTKDDRKDFYRTISRGLQRPLFSIYRRVIRNYDPKNYVGKYSTQDIEQLQELHYRHGNDWATIGNLMGRSASSVKDKCRLMTDLNAGKWLSVEENRLAEAVYVQSGARPGDDISRGLSWSEVSKAVGTRTPKQCRSKWLNYLNWKEKGGHEWSREEDIALIYKVISLKCEREIDINWEKLATNWSCARSPQWLRGKWWSLKRHVSQYHSKSLSEILDNLKETHIDSVKVKDETDYVIPSSSDAYDISEFKLDGAPVTNGTGSSGDSDSVHATYLVTSLSDTPVIFPTDALLADQLVIQPLSFLPSPDMRVEDTGRLSSIYDIAIKNVSNLNSEVGEKSTTDLSISENCDSKTLEDEITVIPCIVQGSSSESTYRSGHAILMSDPMMISNTADIHEEKH